VPVSVWKHWSRKCSVSRISMPDGGSGLSYVDERFGDVCKGFRRVVMAWTP